MKKFMKAAVVVAMLAGSAPAFAGGTYKFTITCSNGGVGVAEWRTGDIDPGKEYLRVATGTNNPGCSISDFDANRDGWAPVTVYEGPAAIPQGIPLLGTILENVFGF